MGTPTFRIDIEKLYLNEYWTNSYITDDPTLPDAIDTADDIVARERSITYAPVTFTQHRVSDIAPGGVFANTPLNLPGLVAVGGALLPLHNVIRVDFAAPTGRPSRKYLRGCLQQADILDPNTIVASTVTRAQTNYADPMAADLNYVDPQGEELNTGVVKSKPGMRQLRRGSRRSTTPIIP